MSSENDVWCSKCMCNISTDDIKSYNVNGCCKRCNAKEVKKSNSNISHPSNLSDLSNSFVGKTMESTNKWQLFFGFLFVLPVLDLLWGKQLPYEYFLLLRVAGFFGFLYLAYELYDGTIRSNDNKYIITFCCLAILYNPIFPIHLSRAAWTPINLCTGFYIWYYFIQIIKDDQGTRNHAKNINHEILLASQKENIAFQKIKTPRKKQPKSDMTDCPFCAEEIKIKAKKCKHCGEWLNDNEDIQL